MKLSLLIATAVACSSIAEAQHLIRTRSSTFAAKYGFTITRIGDVDLDGIPDAAIGTGGNLLDIFSTRTNRRLRRLTATGGSAVAPAGDLDGDGRADIVISNSNTGFNGPSSGTVYVVSAFSGAILRQFNGDSLGDTMGAAASGGLDVDGDLVPDIVGGAFQDDNNGLNSGSVRVWSGATGAELYTLDGDFGADWFGREVLLVPDVDGDGRADLLVGIPKADGFGLDAGIARMFSGASGTALWDFGGWNPGDQLGDVLACVRDCDGDGIDDVAVGVPLADLGGLDFGACAVLSGATGTQLQVYFGEATGDNFGCSVAGGQDINGDGITDLVVGASMNDVAGNNAGAAYLYSGVVGNLIATLHGFAATDQFGFTVGMLEDSNGDGLGDLSVCAAYADYGLNDSGAVYDFALECPPTSIYCTAKLNSLGCSPTIAAFGSPSLSAGSGFTLRVRSILNNQPGFLLYGVSGSAAIPFQGGLLCIGPPANLGPNQTSGGTRSPVHDCSGTLQLDFNAYLYSGAGAPQVHLAGTVVYAQWWSRDTGFAAPNDSSLSDAVRFVICL